MVTNQRCDNQCPQPCDFENYVLKVTSSLWPREEFFNRMVESWRARIKTFRVNDYQTAKRQLGKIEVFFEVELYS